MLILFHPTGILSTAEVRGRGAREFPAVIETYFPTGVVNRSVPGGMQYIEEIRFQEFSWGHLLII